MAKVIISARSGTARTRSRGVVGLAILSVVAIACAGSARPDDEANNPSTSAIAPSTESTVPEIDTAPPVETTAPSTTEVTNSRPKIPLGDDDRVFYAGTDTVIVAHAPAPWEPFDVSSLGMRRDFGTAEWVGISFWEPREVATDSCRWKDSWVDAGESVAELAEALVAIPGRDATTPVPVTVDGYDGLYLEWSLPSDLDIATCDDGRTVAWTGAAKKTRSHHWAGVIDRIWILDVAGTRVLIDVISMPVEQEIIRERADEVIDSLRLAANN